MVKYEKSGVKKTKICIQIFKKYIDYFFVCEYIQVIKQEIKSLQKNLPPFVPLRVVYLLFSTEGFFLPFWLVCSFYTLNLPS